MQAMVRLVDQFPGARPRRGARRGRTRSRHPRQRRDRGLSRQEVGGPCFSIEGLRAGYSAIPVLNDVSITVEAGQFVAIVGPNGAGKTTLFKTISGIVTPSAGAITFEGHDLLSVAAGATRASRHRPCSRRTPGVSVADRDGKSGNGRGHRRPAGATGSSNIERIFEWLPVLAERREQFAGTLSGGQQQMLAIGRGLASSPKLLMLDEPSMGLAPAIADFIFERLIEIRRQSQPDHPAGRTARRRGAGIRRPRLRARSRPRRARRQQPDPAGRRPRPQGLSRHVTNNDQQQHGRNKT